MAVEYYLSATGDGQTVVLDPLDAPMSTHRANAIHQEPLFSDDFESDSGWESVAEGDEETTGRWERVDPVGTLTSQGVIAQPEYDFSPNAGRVCYVTGQHRGGHAGINDVDGGPVRLLSPIISLEANDAVVGFACWFHSSGGTPDQLTVEISRNGGESWHITKTITTTNGWEEHSFRLGEFPEVVGNQLRVRFSTKDLPCDGPDSSCSSLTEAAIDEFYVQAISCSSGAGDFDGDGRIGLSDAQHMIGCLTGPLGGTAGTSQPCGLFDFNDDLSVDLLDCQAFQSLFSPEGD